LPPDLRRVVLWLLAGTLFLPIAIVLILTVARLLAALEDAAGAVAFERLGLVLGIVWALAIVALTVVLALQTLARQERVDEDEKEE
jgi:heme/copper-type cytochrome/quinol oxidase subunit 2